MNRIIWSGIGIAALVLSFLIWRSFHDKGIRTEQHAVFVQDSIAAVTKVLETADARRHMDSIAASKSLKAAYDAGTRHHVAANVSQACADSLHKLVHTLASLEAEVTCLQSSNASLRAELGEKEKRIVILSAQYASADSSSKAWESVAAETRKQLALANKRATSHWACVLGAGGTAGVGAVGSTTISAGFGATAGLGAMCGYKL